MEQAVRTDCVSRLSG